jgi:hypothetical protein
MLVEQLAVHPRGDDLAGVFVFEANQAAKPAAIA